MRGTAKNKSRGSLFSNDEIADFSNQENLAQDQQKQQEQSHAAPLPDGTEFIPRAKRSNRRQSSIDDSSVLQMMQDASLEQQRYSMDHRLRKVFILLIAFVAIYIASLILPDHIVSAVFDPNTQTLSEVIQSNFQQLAQVLSGQSPVGLEYSSIVIMLLIALVGAGLAAVGASYQVTFRNQLATPSSLGVMSGAALGSVFFYLTCQNEAAQIAQRIAVTEEQAAQLATSAQANPLTTYLGFIEGAIYAMAGAFIVVILTAVIAKLAGRGKLNNAVLIIAGQVFASIANAFIVLFRLYLETTLGQDAVSSFAMAQIGDLSGIGRTYDLLFMGLPIVIALVVLYLLAPQMNAIALGGDEAQALGLRVDVVRVLVIVLSTVVTAVIVAFVGSIGFVGFAIPQMVRRFVGPDFRYLLPASALAGASFLLVVNFVYSSFTFTTTGIGVVTSLIGGVVFVITVARQRRTSSNAQ